jgi:hypothetical protein
LPTGVVTPKDSYIWQLYVEKTVSGPDHPFTGYFLPYPAKDFDGVVSTIDKMNMLNWIYIDSATCEVKYGVRVGADKHITGPMGILASPDGKMRAYVHAVGRFCRSGGRG